MYHRHGLGLTRREPLQVGYSGLLGIGVPSLWSGQAQAGPTSATRANSVVLIFLTGAPSHLDTFDLKPEAPVEIRCEFKKIATQAPGVCVLRTSAEAGRPCRQASGDSLDDAWATQPRARHAHDADGHRTCCRPGRPTWPPGPTGRATRPGSTSSAHEAMACPSGVHLPTYLNNGYGFSGQNAGVLGPKFDPWHIKPDPNDAGFRVDDLSLPVGLTAEQDRPPPGAARRDRGQTCSIDRIGDRPRVRGIQDKAFTMLTSGRVKRAFELDREDPRLRDRYGRHMFGQSLLLSRRLIQAGVPIVQANMGHMNNWDTHTDNCQQLKTRLLPPLDQGVSAFLDDLEASGLLDETLVVMVGEFGRTPKIGQSSVNDLPRRPAATTGRASSPPSLPAAACAAAR